MSGEPARTVLYVNQKGEVSGAERSLLDLLDALPHEISPVLACPNGPLPDAVRERGVPTVRIPGTDASFRAHPYHSAAGVAWIARAARRLRSLARSTGASLVHANTAHAGLAATVSRQVGGVPTVVHVRDRMPSGVLAAATLRAIALGADAIVANSHYCAAQFGRGSGAPSVEVVHNSVDCARFDPDRLDRDRARRRARLGPRDLALAVVGHLSPIKAQDDAIRVLARLKPAHPRLRLLLAGSAKFTARAGRFDNVEFERGLRALAKRLGVDRDVIFLGECANVAEVLRAADLMLVPSWREGFGRVVLEGMAMELPVIATAVGGPAEIIQDGADGVLVAPRQPERWAAAAAELLARPDVREAIGRRARRTAIERFNAEAHVARITEVYERVLDGRRGGGRR